MHFKKNILSVIALLLFYIPLQAQFVTNTIELNQDAALALAKQANANAPVSYTHLDVYKRQVL